MSDKKPPIDFTSQLKELEEITAWFESEEIDLDQALVKFERGMTLATELKNHLANVENRVEKIKQKFDSPMTAAVDDFVPDEPAPVTEPDLFNQI